MKILYFAWVRERIGLPSEELENRSGTVHDLIEELRAREERYEAAFADLSALLQPIDLASIQKSCLSFLFEESVFFSIKKHS